MNESTHHVDGGVVAVEEAGRGHQPDLVDEGPLAGAARLVVTVGGRRALGSGRSQWQRVGRGPEANSVAPARRDWAP